MTPTKLCLCASLLLIALLCAGCVTETSQSDRGSFLGKNRQPLEDQEPTPRAERAAAMAATDVGNAADAEQPRNPSPAPAPRVGKIPDTRVMLYQPKGDLLLIIVNESHSGRATEAGRLDIALNNPGRAYKILSDAQIEALLKSMVAQGYDTNAAEFVPEDAQYLTAASADLPRYQGLISVERGALKTKVLGFRKSSEGDALGARRYTAYTVLKSLVQKWFKDSSRDEYPVGGVSLPSKGP